MTLIIKQPTPKTPALPSPFIKIRDYELLKYLKLVKTEKELAAERQNREQVEKDLASESKKLSNWKGISDKRKKGIEALRQALDDAQQETENTKNKAANDKADLLAKLKDLNDKIGAGTISAADVDAQIVNLNNKLDEVLANEARPELTALEKKQKQYLTELQDQALILSPEEKKALDFTAGYYYWHEANNAENAKKDREALNTYISDPTNRANIRDAVLFFSNLVFKHNQEEGEKHEQIKKVAEVDNNLKELEQKYKDKDAELLDAKNELVSEGVKIKWLKATSEKDYKQLEKQLDKVSERNEKSRQNNAKEKAVLLAKIGILRQDLANQSLTEAEKDKKILALNDEINRYLSDNVDAKDERDIARKERDQARIDLATERTAKDTNAQKINDNIIRLQTLADGIAKGTVQLKTQTISNGINDIINRLKA